MKHKNTRYMVKFRKPGEATVEKWEPGGDDGFVQTATYEVKDGACSCKAFEFKRLCKHLTIVESPPLETPPVTNETAQVVIAQVRAAIQDPALRAMLDRTPTGTGITRISFLRPGDADRVIEGVVMGVRVRVVEAVDANYERVLGHALSLVSQ